MRAQYTLEAPIPRRSSRLSQDRPGLSRDGLLPIDKGDRHEATDRCARGCVRLRPLPADADERGNGNGPERSVVTVAFGAGLNTAQPGNAENHHVIPDTIRVNVGDVVNFSVSGFHIIRVYGNGVSLSAVKAEIPDECEVNPLPPATFPPQCGAPPVPVVSPGALSVYYQGINSLVSPQPGPPFAQPSPADQPRGARVVSEARPLSRDLRRAAALQRQDVCLGRSAPRGQARAATTTEVEPPRDEPACRTQAGPASACRSAAGRGRR